MYRAAGGDADLPEMRRAGPLQPRAEEKVAILETALNQRYPNPEIAATRKATRAAAIPIFSIF